MEQKTCIGPCGRTLPLDLFYRHPEARDGHRNQCKSCVNERARKQGRPKRRARRAVHQQGVKNAVFQAYGGYCCCCGETDPRLLTLDHVNNDGAEHRRSLGNRSRNLYRWARENGFPATLQVACWNCNTGRHLNNGTCPHQDRLMAITRPTATTC